MERACPVFILGSPRSGTSLLRLMLTAHPQLQVPPECGYLIWLQAEFGGWSEADLASPQRQQQWVRAVQACRKFDTWQLSDDALLHSLRVERPSTYAALGAVPHLAYARRNGRAPTRWGDKNNFHLQHLPALRALYPGASFLHIVRDGRDVACSYREVMAAASRSPYAPQLVTQVEQIAHQWAGDIELAQQGLRGLAPSQQHHLRYEDLVRSPEAVLQAVCAWLGLPWSADMLAFHQVNQQQGLEPAATLDWKRRTLEPVSDATVGRHLRALSALEQDTFLRLAGPQLRRLGYAP
jgi:hypothetical protein